MLHICKGYVWSETLIRLIKEGHTGRNNLTPAEGLALREFFFLWFLHQIFITLFWYHWCHLSHPFSHVVMRNKWENVVKQQVHSMKLTYLRNSLPFSLSPSPLLSSCLAFLSLPCLITYPSSHSFLLPFLWVSFLPYWYIMFFLASWNLKWHQKIKVRPGKQKVHRKGGSHDVATFPKNSSPILLTYLVV